MNVTATAHRKVGRPYIGPKVQTFVPVAVHDRVEAEAIERGCPCAEVWREMILFAAAELYSMEVER